MAKSSHQRRLSHLKPLMSNSPYERPQVQAALREAILSLAEIPDKEVGLPQLHVS